MVQILRSSLPDSRRRTSLEGNHSPRVLRLHTNRRHFYLVNKRQFSRLALKRAC